MSGKLTFLKLGKTAKVELTEKERFDASHKIEEIVKDLHYNGTDVPRVSVYIARPRKQVPDFVILFQAINKMLSKQLSPIECKLLLLLYSDAGYSNYLGRAVQSMAEDCGLSRKTVSKALNKLMELNIIERIKSKNDKRHFDYAINPYMTWRGGMPERDKAIKIINEKMKKNFPKQLKLFKIEEENSMNLKNKKK